MSSVQGPKSKWRLTPPEAGKPLACRARLFGFVPTRDQFVPDKYRKSTGTRWIYRYGQKFRYPMS